MDFHTGLFLVCMLFARTCCQPLRKGTEDGALASTVKTLMEEIQSMLGHLSAPGLLPNISCGSLNMTELLPPEHQPLTVHISTFSCYMQEFAEPIPELSEELKTSAQFMQDVERLLSNQTSSKNCSLPTFDTALDPYINAKCFLQHVQKILPKL